jgi:hypothetical protein
MSKRTEGYKKFSVRLSPKYYNALALDAEEQGIPVATLARQILSTEYRLDVSRGMLPPWVPRRIRDQIEDAIIGAIKDLVERDE